MPRSAPVAQLPTLAGTAPNFTAPDALGDVVTPGRVMLWVKNGSASPVTVTIESPATFSGLALAEAGGSVPAAGERVFGPFSAALFGRPDGGADAGSVYVNYSAITSVTRAIVGL